MKTLERSFKEAALAVIAAENGIISPNKLVYILSLWISEPGVSIIERLKETLPPESLELLDLVESKDKKETSESDPFNILIESVQRIKEKTVMTVMPSAKGENNASDRLITDESPGRYVIQGELARGGAGRVLIVLDRHLGREVAMKELLLDLRDARDGEKRMDPHTKSLRNRFLREARVTGQLEHPSIVPVYEIGQHPDGVFYYTMRMVNGRTLSKAIKQCRSLHDRMELLPHFYNICNAVAYAHSKGVLNRDLKPSNVMIGEFGETVVLDWGLAKVKGQHDAGADKIQSGLRLFMNADVGKTVVGFAIGTPSYMPPEQAEGNIDEIDETSDIYSLGAILYQLLTGRPPYNGKTASEILRKVVAGEFAPVSDYEPEASPELSAIVEKALSKEKKKRYQTATELIEELNSYMSGGKVSGYKYSFMELIKKFTSRNKAVFISSFLIFLMLTLSTISITWYYRREVRAKQAAQAEKVVSQFRAAQAFNEKSIRLELEKRFLSSRIYAAASMLYNPANINSVHYDPDHEEKFGNALSILADSSSRFYQRHFHRGAVFDRGVDTDCRITAFDSAPDGKRFYAGCENGEIRAYDARTLKEVLRFKAGTRITGMTVSHDGRKIVFSTASGEVSALDADSGKKTNVYGRMPGGTNCILAQEEGKFIICGRDGVVRVTDFSDNGEIEIKSEMYVKEALLIDEGRNILLVSQASLVKYDIVQNRETGRIDLGNDLISAIKISENSGTLFIGTDSGTIYIADIGRMEVVESLKNLSSKITSICFSVDGSLFLTSDNHRKTTVWDYSRREPLFTTEGHKDAIVRSMFDNFGRNIISSSSDGSIKVWQLHGRKSFPSFTVKTPFINGAVFAEGLTGFSSRSEKVVFFDTDSNEQLVFNDHKGAVYDIDASRDGNLIAIGGWDTSVTVFSASGLKTLLKLKGNSNAVADIEFTPDSRYLVTGGRDGSVRMFSVSDGLEKDIWNCKESAVVSLNISSDGKKIAVLCESEGLFILEVPFRDKVEKIDTGNRLVKSFVFDHTGNSIIVGKDDGQISIIEIESGKSAALRGHSGKVLKMMMSVDGNYLAASGTDLSVKIWDYAKRFPLLTINTEKEPGCILFTPDSRSLMICDGNKARIWPLESIELKKDPVELLAEMEKDSAMKLKDFYLEPGI